MNFGPDDAKLRGVLKGSSFRSLFGWKHVVRGESADFVLAEPTVAQLSTTFNAFYVSKGVSKRRRAT